MNIVKQSLYLCIGVLLLLLGVQGTQALWQTHRLSQATEQVVQSGALKEGTQALWSSFLEAEAAFLQATAFTSVDDTEQASRRFATVAVELRQNVARLQALGSTQGQAVSAEVDAWLGMAERHLGTQGLQALPSHHLLQAAHEDLHARLDALRDDSTEAAEVAIAAGQSLTRAVYLWTLAEMVLAVALGAVLGWYALRNLHRQLGADASEVARVATAVADGDLTLALDAQALPEGSVMAATARMQQSLIRTVLNVRAISDELAQGVDEIAAGNSDLSSRTERQAAAIERTASTMEQLGSTVRHNADNAGQASQLADSASEVASLGGSVVNDAVLTMRDINERSRRISEIIAVIDGIAFQTNILALNAAVEAARAGDQGRGFAVVAGEVRSLAQRSAQAAREIKNLITDNVNCVDQGTALVERAGQTMAEVVASIQRVTDVMGEIRHASAEQSTGVSQVGQAITEVDQATQQNAALAEEGAAAAATLRARGRQLLEAMAFFKLPERSAVC